MTVSRRTMVKLGLGAGASSLIPVAHGTADAASSGDRPPDPTSRLRARRLPLSAVRLTGGPLAHAQRLDGDYLLALEPDRMLAPYRKLAGLTPKGEAYGGWDGPGRNLTGHIGGHYLSAVSLMWAATGDARFRDRAAYIVDELKLVQDRHGDGFVGALEGVRDAFARLSRGEIRSAAFDLNGEWSPWYTLHKTYGGLRDAYRFTGNRTALDIERGFAAWAEGVVAPLSDEQIQRMLNTEFGGMNEVFVDLWEDTGDDRWLRLSYKFEHTDFLEPLRRHQDNLANKHGNTQIPKLIGSADRYVLGGDPDDLLAAAFFWDEVAHRHSFATGGHGTDEYFGPPGRLADRIDGRTAETCNVYNMIKLTRRLFEIAPAPSYADFHERALFNHILSSIDPEDGRTCYMVPVGRRVAREYQNMQRSFTCCVGSGMESHALHGDGLYYEADGRLWVSLYAPSTAEWASAGVRLDMETDFPLGETAHLAITADKPRAFTLSLRRPYWTGDGFRVRVNGEEVPLPPTGADVDAPYGSNLYAWDFPASTYVDVGRTWRSGDVVEIDLPRSLHVEGLPDRPSRASLMWGPLVLAGDLGPQTSRGDEDEDMTEDPTTVPVFVREEGPVSDWLKPTGVGPGRFRTAGAGREPNATGAAREVDFAPFYQLQRRTYSTYWDLFTPGEWAAQRAAYAEEAERQRLLEAATVAWIQPGETVFEREFGYQGSEGVYAARLEGRPGRRGRGWFSLDVPLGGATGPLSLILTYFSDDRRAMPARFDVSIDGALLSTQEVVRGGPRRFYDVEIPMPVEMTRGNDRVTLRFQSREGSQIATVFGVRLVRADGRRRRGP
jgi:DUF1680 family protein